MSKKQLNSVKAKPSKYKGAQARRDNRRPTLLLAAGILLIVVAVGIWAWSNRQANAGTTAGLPAEINVQQAMEKRTAGAFILDVREQNEWDQVHIPDATLIPLGQLSTRVNELPKDQEIVVVCRSGNRSKQGRDILLQAGFTQVTSMAGGMTDWSKAGFPTVSGP